MHYEKEGVYISREPSTKDAFVVYMWKTLGQEIQNSYVRKERKKEGHRLGNGNEFRETSRKIERKKF